MSTTKPLVIDAQIFQTTAWGRGMGHYCRSLLAAYAAEYGTENITLVVNKHLPLEKERAEAIRAILPGASIEALDLPTLTGDILAGKRAATGQLDHFTRQRFGDQTVDFLILQLFTFDYCAAFPTNAHKSVIIYDLIPLLHWEQFSPYFAAHMYFPHFTTILEADTVLAISQAAKEQLVNSFALDPANIINLRGATIARKSSGTGLKGIDQERPYLLMPTADFPHKNNLNAVQAFESFNRELGSVCQLVLTSDLSEASRRLLSYYCDDLVFVGNVTDDKLAYLYERALGLLFTSSIEGLGLPILEAVQEDKPVVCSSIDVFKEIDPEAFYYCDPHDVGSIATALQQLAGRVDWEAKHARYAEIRGTYTWTNSAGLLHETLASSPSRVEQAPGTGVRVALPNPAQWDTTIGTLAQAVLAMVAKGSPDTKFYMASSEGVLEAARPLFLPWIHEVHDMSEFMGGEGSKNIYFIDESEASAEALRGALLYPGTCYVTARNADGLLRGLLERGYISEELQAAYKSQSKALTLPHLLRAAGNTVYELKQDRDAVTVKGVDATLKLGNPHDFALWLTKEEM